MCLGGCGGLGSRAASYYLEWKEEAATAKHLGRMSSSERLGGDEDFALVQNCEAHAQHTHSTYTPTQHRHEGLRSIYNWSICTACTILRPSGLASSSLPTIITSSHGPHSHTSYNLHHITNTHRSRRNHASWRSRTAPRPSSGACCPCCSRRAGSFKK